MNPPDRFSSPPTPDEHSGSPQRSLSIYEAECALASGTIADVQGVMRWGSNYAALVSIYDGDKVLTAVYKPQRGERSLWDFPDGTLCYREVLAYHVSQALGWELVPATVLRDGPHGIGSVQLFIEHDPAINFFTLDDSFNDQLQRFAAFDAVINNADRKGGHLLLDAQNKLWGIDHGLAFHSAPKLRTVIWEFERQPIPEPLLESLASLQNDILCKAAPWIDLMQSWLSANEISALVRRIEKLLTTRVFPSPSGHGPSYPWPPV
jgi:uncharacterized repeat protein (TIGR03843 family)